MSCSTTSAARPGAGPHRRPEHLRALSAMSEDAISDDVAEGNFVRGYGRAHDPRVVGEIKPPRVLTFEQMHQFAATGGPCEPMRRVFADCGLRLGKVLGSSVATSTATRLPHPRLAHAGRSTSGDSRRSIRIGAPMQSLRTSARCIGLFDCRLSAAEARNAESGLPEGLTLTAARGGFITAPS